MTAAPAAPTTFTLRRVQELLGLSRSVLTGLIAAGFVTPSRGPRNEQRFSFQDLLLLRTAHTLHASKIPPRRIVRSLEKLKASLPDQLPLTGLRITAVGTEVAVRDRAGRLEAASGQLLMDFEVSSAAGAVSFLDRSPPPPAADPAVLFQAAESLESTDLAAAEAAYRRTLTLAPGFTDAYLNLGAILCESTRSAEAIALYDDALRQCAPHALLHFNRAVALEDQRLYPEAIAAYERSLKLDAGLADAHYNIGCLEEKLGNARSALRHFNAYRRLQP